jgi:hypothetical protein
MNSNKFDFPHYLDDQPLFRVGTVVEFNPATFTADVQMTRSEIRMAAPILGLGGQAESTDMSWQQNLRGATVAMVLIEGEYYVMSTLPTAVQEHTAGPQSGVTPDTSQAEQDVLTQRETEITRTFNNNRPKTLLPGDKFIRAEDGAELGLLQGGMATLKASPLAQLILGKFRDFARLVARRVQVFSDFGEIELFHRDGGKVGLEIFGGTRIAETHPNKKTWSVYVSLGHKAGDPNSRIYLEARDGSGAAKATANFMVNGKLKLWAETDIDIEAGSKINMVAADAINLQAPRVNTN